MLMTLLSVPLAVGRLSVAGDEDAAKYLDSIFIDATFPWKFANAEQMFDCFSLFKTTLLPPLTFADQRHVAFPVRRQGYVVLLLQANYLG